ncbi:hypothetical protein D5S17_19660 [Pseudonocardiaceae bacterium YIM PH 21723]|nr:hypothetical protein D5S17_19660 [Pseudonocardiaceae bacterium YIM PH 21723]
MLREIGVVRPFSIERFCDRLEDLRGRPLQLHPRPVELAALPCGLYIRTTEVDHIFYDPDTSHMHQEHVILHELGHMLFDHSLDQPLDSLLNGHLANAQDFGGSPQQAGIATGYSDDQERAAEVFATVVLETADRTPDQLPPHDFVTRLARNLGAPVLGP